MVLMRGERGDLCHAGAQDGETLAHLPFQPVDPPSHLGSQLDERLTLFELGLPRSVQDLDVRPQLGADLGDIPVSASGQDVCGTGHRVRDGGPFTEAGQVTFDHGQAGLEVLSVHQGSIVAQRSSAGELMKMSIGGSAPLGDVRVPPVRSGMPGSTSRNKPSG